MLNLRIKLDVWLAEIGVPQPTREVCRQKLEDAYTRLPSDRFLLYTKSVRLMLARGRAGERADVKSMMSELASNPIILDKPEEIIAAGSSWIFGSSLHEYPISQTLKYYLTDLKVHQIAIFQAATGEAVNRIIYNTARNSISIEKAKLRGCHLWSPVDAGAVEKAHRIRGVVFRSGPFSPHPHPREPILNLAGGLILKLIDFLGFVHQCGVPVIQDLARARLRSWILSQNFPTTAILHENFLNEREVLELKLRVWLRKEIEARLEAGAAPQLSWLDGKARKIWFELTYPTPPTPP